MMADHLPDLSQSPEDFGTYLQRQRRLDVLRWLYVIALALSLACGILLLKHDIGSPLPLNVKLTKQAWDDFNKGDYERAIKSAEQCVSGFQVSAEKIELEITQRGTNGSETGLLDKTHSVLVLSRGPLNDVGTCYFIIGDAALKLNRIQAAVDAFRSASKYNHARAYDGKGSFWSPAEAAREKLAAISEGGRN
jgi:tetratricopeptide (TPR) repeat protein